MGVNMKSFDYLIKDDMGLHARPAGMLVKEVKNYESTITLISNGKSANASKLLAVLGLGAKKGTNLTVQAEGPDEDKAVVELEKFLSQNL